MGFVVIANQVLELFGALCKKLDDFDPCTLGCPAYPFQHGSRNIMTRHQFCALPLEHKIWIEDFVMPVRHVCQFIHPPNHGNLSHDIAEKSIVE